MQTHEHKPMVRMYAPEHWGQLERFARFYSTTFNFDATTKKAVSGAIHHFKKAEVLKGLAVKLKPNLSIDRKELQEKGFTPARNANELSAVIEGVIIELYSSIDCARKVVFEVYKRTRGLPDSTRKMFRKMQLQEHVNDFPHEIKAAFESAIWFNELRIMRDELTHLSLGSCHLDQATSKVSYMHQGIRNQDKPLIIDDIFAELERFFCGVNEFLGRVFHFLNSRLENKRVQQTCGIFSGRMYIRNVSPHEATDFNGGVCESFKWFDQPEEPRCSFAENCGAYKSVNSVS
jgi:hypothetical protein